MIDRFVWKNAILTRPPLNETLRKPAKLEHPKAIVGRYARMECSFRYGENPSIKSPHSNREFGSVAESISATPEQDVTGRKNRKLPKSQGAPQERQHIHKRETGSPPSWEVTTGCPLVGSSSMFRRCKIILSHFCKGSE